VRATLPIAVLIALVALVAGAALWLSREDGVAVAPVSRAAAQPSARSESDGVEAEARVAAAPAEPSRDEKLPAPRVPKSPPKGTAALAGRLRLDGGPPGEVVALVLEERDGLPQSDLWTRVRELASRPDGSFHVGDLPDGWSGRLRLPAHYRRTDVPAKGPDARVQGVRR